MDTWICPNCGRTGLTGNFCGTCATPRPTPTPMPTPSPEPTLTPGPTSNLEPMPGPAPTDNQTTTTYTVNNSDKSYTVYDKLSGHELYSVKSDGTFTILGNNYTNYIHINSGLDNLDISKLSYDDKKATITIKNDDGKPLLVIKNSLGIVEKYNYSDYQTDIMKYDYNGLYVGYEEHRDNGEITIYGNAFNNIIKKIYPNGDYDIYEDGNIIKYNLNNEKIRTTYSDGSYVIYEENRIFKYDATSNEYMYIYEDGTKKYIRYDTDGNEYMHIYEDGKKVYLKSNKESLIIYPNGTFYNISDEIKGKYSIEIDGNIKCISNENDTYIYNSSGILLETVDRFGKKTVYNYDDMTQTITKNDSKSISKINHIEYDEEAYDNILKSFNNLSSTYKGKIKSTCSAIESAVNSFPDPCSCNVGEVESSIEGNINLISSLSEVTNYSLLAYQACDNDLKDNLNLLIDTLFDDKDSAKTFKKAINYTIEDRDHDGILEYKLDTDFDKVSNELIPTKTYIDDDGNVLYFNNIGRLLSHDGNNIKISYGGEEFTLNFGENGCAILKDSLGKPINIFGDYNLSSSQYGGNQGVFWTNGAELLNDNRINEILDRYFPGASYEEKNDYLIKMAFSGCGYVAMTNIAFKMMEGYEEVFQDKFGYPMYDIIYKDNSVSVDYNYEPLALELCSECKGKDWYGNTKTISDATDKLNGTGKKDKIKMEYYLINKCNVYDYNPNTKITWLSGQSNYILDDMQSSKIEYAELEGHAMIITEENNDGTKYVSSYGQKYRFELMQDGIGVEEEFPLCDALHMTDDFSNGVRYSIEYNKMDGKVDYLKVNRMEY